jgi:hypothetical protein
VTDLVGPLIGGGITGGLSLIGFAYGYGRFSQRIEHLTEAVDKLSNSIDHMRDDLVSIHERLAKLEARP